MVLEDDKAFILNPARWPWYPLLPLKRPSLNSAWPEMGKLYAGEHAGPVTVYSRTIFDPGLGEAIKTYPSVDALLADGWRVD